MKKNFWVLILGLVTVGVFAWYFNNYYIEPSIKDTSVNLNSGEVKDIKIEEGELIAGVKTKNATQIIAFSESGKNKIYFTDADERSKIKKIGQALSNKVLVIFNDNKLAEIQMDGTGKKEILNISFGSSSDFILSPDGKKIAFITFSNAERDYGYKLNISDPAGNNQKEILKSDYAISDVVWQDNNTLIFSLDKNEGLQSSVQVADISTGKIQNIFSTDNEIYGLNYKSGKIILSQGKPDSNSSFLWQMDSKGKNGTIVYTEKKGIIYDPVISPNANSVAYLLNARVSEDPLGTIYTIGLDGNNRQKISQAFKLITWYPNL